VGYQRIGFDVEIFGIMERASRNAGPQLRSSIEHAHHIGFLVIVEEGEGRRTDFSATSRADFATSTPFPTSSTNFAMISVFLSLMNSVSSFGIFALKFLAIGYPTATPTLSARAPHDPLIVLHQRIALIHVSKP